MNHIARHNYIDATIEQSRQLLDSPVIGRYLTEKDRHISADFLDQLFVPNIRDGSLVMPKEYQDSDKLPIVALTPSEGVNAGSLQFTSTQRMLARDTFQTLPLTEDDPEGATESLINILAQIISEDRLHINSRHGAATSRPRVRLQLGDTSLRAITRPHIILAYHEDLPFLAQPSALVHEGMHAYQGIVRALGSLPQNICRELLEDELKAYQVGFGVLQANLHVPEVQDAVERGKEWSTSLVEGLRAKHNSEDAPYEAKPALVQAFASAGILAGLVENAELTSFDI